MPRSSALPRSAAGQTSAVGVLSLRPRLEDAAMAAQSGGQGNVPLLGSRIGPTTQVEPCSIVCSALAGGLCAALWLLCGCGRSSRALRFRPKQRRQTGRQAAGGGAAGQETGKEPQKSRRVRRSAARAQRPGRQSRMRLARPPRGQPALARRSRHRLPPSRSLRSIWLSERPHPGDVPLPDPARKQHRSEGRRQP